MDPITQMPTAHAPLEPLERDLAEIDAAISLVVGGAATRVRLVGLTRADALAAVGLARAQAAGIRFEIDRGITGVVALTLGPRVTEAE